MSLKVGDKFNRLEVIGIDYRFTPKGNKYKICKCLCDCGNTSIVHATSLTRKTRPTISCGCYKDEIQRNKATHGDARSGNKSKLYILWASMKKRCGAKGMKDSKYYSEKGIKVCDEWSNNYSIFKEWAQKNGYQKGFEIDRINNDGNYEPSNCRFITHKENMRNTSYNKMDTAFNETKCISEWTEDKRCKVSRRTLSRRFEPGIFIPELAITMKSIKELRNAQSR